MNRIDEDAADRERGSSDLMEVVGAVLRLGVYTSLSLVVIGMGVSIFHHPDYWRDPSALHRLLHPSEGPHRVGDVAASVAAFRGQAIVMLGLLVLIATPVIRVAASLRHFRRVRDRAYTIFTSIVLSLLLLSFVLGRAGGG